jgi:hypothetical protein
MRHALARHAVTALIAASVLAWLAGPGHAQFVLYDDFSSGVISPDRWQGVAVEGTFSAPTTEVIRAVQSGALRLALVSWGNDTCRRLDPAGESCRPGRQAAAGQMSATARAHGAA